MYKHRIVAYVGWVLGLFLFTPTMTVALPAPSLVAPMRVLHQHTSATCSKFSPVTSYTPTLTNLGSPMTQETLAPSGFPTETTTQRAWLYSALLPACGQVYNQQYWKVPLIYLVFAGLGGGVFYYHREYTRYKTRLLALPTHHPIPFSVTNYIDDCRGGRDLFLIFSVLWHIINVLDAYVGASLRTFTLSNDISMKVQPRIVPIVPDKSLATLHLTIRVET